MDSLSKNLAALIELEGVGVAPPPAVKERHWEAIAARTGGPPEGGPAEPSGSAAGGVTAARVALAVATSGVAAALLLGVASVVESQDGPAEALHLPRPHRTEVEDAAESGQTRATEEHAQPRTPDPAEPVRTALEAVEPPAVASPKPKRSRAAPRGGAHGGLRAELRLIDQAARQFRAGQSRAALRSLADHASRFPLGELTPERLDLEAAARCTLGQRHRGEALLEKLRRGWPKNPVSDLANKACELEAD